MSTALSPHGQPGCGQRHRVHQAVYAQSAAYPTEVHNRACSYTVTLPRPKGGRNGELKAAPNSERVLFTRPGCAYVVETFDVVCGEDTVRDRTPSMKPSHPTSVRSWGVLFPMLTLPPPATGILLF